MKDTLRVAGVYVGTIIGAGFASGQEVLQFYTGYGWLGILGTLVTVVLYPLLGYYLVVLGKRVKAQSHKSVIYHIAGKYLGFVIDLLLTFFLFGVAVIMVAGSGSLFQQQFGMSPSIGYAIMAILIVLALLLSLRRVLNVISSIAPFAFVIIVVLALYALFTADTSGVDLEAVSATQEQLASPHWLLSAFLHVSFNVALSVSILAIMGATEQSHKAAKRGAILGGVVLGIIALVINLAMYFNVDELIGTEMPMLAIANDVNPIVGLIVALLLLAMIFNTAVPMLYTFTARFFEVDTPRFKIAALVGGIVAFALGFVGFTELVNQVYPLLGYLGFVIFMCMAVNLVLIARRRSKGTAAEVSDAGQ